jgi:hypothetical protein
MFSVWVKSGFETHRRLAFGNLEGNKLVVAMASKNLTLPKTRRHKVCLSATFPVMREAVEYANDLIKCMYVSINTEFYPYINKTDSSCPNRHYDRVTSSHISTLAVFWIGLGESLSSNNMSKPTGIAA